MRTAAVFCLAAGLAAAQTVKLTVNPGSVVHSIDPKIYGQSLELSNGGIWGEVVWNRSFEETLTWGAWRVNGGVLEAAGGNDESRFSFGDGTWRDYDLTVDVMRPAGSGVLRVGVRNFMIDNFALSLGGTGGFELTRTRHIPQAPQPETAVLQTVAGQIENERWYRVRVRIEGTRLQSWLDGKLLCDRSAADGSTFGYGRAFVGVTGGPARFAHLHVTSISGETLFQGVPTAARHWFAVGPGEIAMNTNAPLNGTRSLRIVSRDDDSGIEQPGYAVRVGDALRGALWLAGTGPGIVVRLVEGDKILAEESVAAPSAEWQEFPLLLNPAAPSGNAALRILARAGSAVKLDQVSLMPDSYRANGGFRTDLTQAVAALHPPILRWPGDTLVPNYRWKDGIGPQSKRVGHGWWDPLAFGIDEFLAFARKVGAEPVILIPAGPRIAVERAGFVQDAVDLVEYCNAPPDSAWGKVRTRNGHPEPYRVKYWELNHVLHEMTAAEYVEAVGQFFPAMKRVDPAIRTIANDYLAQVQDLSQLADYLRVRYYGQSGRLAYEIARSANPKLKLFVSEWEPRSADWRRGLDTGGILNAMESDASIGMAATAQLLQHIPADFPADALIQFDQRSWFPSPDYVVMKLYRDHFAPDLLEIAGDPAGLSATATRTADGETIYLKLVNPADREVAVEVALRGDFPLLAASMQLVAPDSLDARNTLDRPTAVQVVEGEVERAGMTARLRLPRWSVAVVTLSR